MSNAAEVAEVVAPATEGTKEQIEAKDAGSGNPEESTEEVPESEATGDPDAQDVDAELEEMKQRLAQMEAESAGVKEDTSSAAAQGQPNAQNGAHPGNGVAGAAPVNPNLAAAGPTRIPLSTDAAADADARSIYVGNVDYSATGDQLGAHFSDCGTINRVTIMCDKATGQPKGFAYIEFDDHNAAQNALILNESTFLGRQLKVVPKRTNIPGVYRGRYVRGRPRYPRGGRGYPRRPRRSWRGRWSPY